MLYEEACSGPLVPHSVLGVLFGGDRSTITLAVAEA
jgi:hypothetical protein